MEGQQPKEAPECQIQALSSAARKEAPSISGSLHCLSGNGNMKGLELVSSELPWAPPPPEQMTPGAQLSLPLWILAAPDPTLRAEVTEKKGGKAEVGATERVFRNEQTKL